MVSDLCIDIRLKVLDIMLNRNNRLKDNTMSVIEGYNILEIIARGGMATIYLAQQSSLKRQVALKILSPKIDESIREHFIDEGRIVAQLKHPNIIPVFDVGRVGVHFYHAMEYLEGGDLEHLMLKGLDAQTALEITLELADALHLVHSQGIIHGDIKPANVVFRANGCPVLTDFGISRRAKQSDDYSVNPDAIMASPSYASPELIQGKAFDMRTDIYSLGIMMYEMLLGKKPFSGNSRIEIIANSIQQPIPQLPEKLIKLQPLLEQMLAKDMQERVADASMINRYIKNFLRHNPSVLNRTPDEKRRSPIKSNVVIEYPPEARANKMPGRPVLVYSLTLLFLTTLITLGSWFYLA